VALLTITAVVVGATPAEAANPTCTPPAVAVFHDDGSYSCTVPGDGGDDGDDGGGGGGGSAPACDLSLTDNSHYYGQDPDSSGTYCRGTTTCFNVAHFTPWEMPEGDKPSEDSEARIEFCYDSLFGGTPTMRRIYWTDADEPPSLLEQAQTAIGQIDLGAPTINVSPAQRTLVNLDTWFWLTGAPERATGSSAFGLVAIATFSDLTVDPGDGSGSFSCRPLPTTASEGQSRCHHEYARSSSGGSASVGGRPAFEVTSNTVYTLRFEVNGDPREIPGAPTALDGPPSTKAVRVDEVQTVTRPNR
jgi:hypothetical protein